jgi:hypothetical protein
MEAQVNKSTEKLKNLLRPNLRLMRATMGMIMTVERMYPVETHVISSTEAPRVPRMWGSATFTMLVSMADMIVPVITVMVMSHLWLI